MVYQWKNGYDIKTENVDAGKVYKEIQSIGDNVTPKDVLKKAKSSKTELHKCFEWDDSVAAEKFRVHQASNVLRSIIVIDDNETSPIKHSIRAFEHINVGGKNLYMETKSILTDEEKAEKLIAEIMQSILELENKLRTYESFSSKVFEVREKLTGLRNELQV